MAPDATRPLHRLLSSHLLPQLGLRRARALRAAPAPTRFSNGPALPAAPSPPPPDVRTRDAPRPAPAPAPPGRLRGSPAPTRARASSNQLARGARSAGSSQAAALRPRHERRPPPKPSFRYDNGRSEFRTFALGKVGQSPISLALSSPRGLNLLPLPASPRRSDKAGPSFCPSLWGSLPTFIVHVTSDKRDIGHLKNSNNNCYYYYY